MTFYEWTLILYRIKRNNDIRQFEIDKDKIFWGNWMALYANAHVKNGNYTRDDFYPEGIEDKKEIDPVEFQDRINKAFEARKLKQNG